MVDRKPKSEVKVWSWINDDLKGVNWIARVRSSIMAYCMDIYGACQKVKVKRRGSNRKADSRGGSWRSNGNEQMLNRDKVLMYCRQGVRSRLATPRKAELLRWGRKKKEQARDAFYKDPFKFVKSSFTQEKVWELKKGSIFNWYILKIRGMWNSSYQQTFLQLER